MPNNDLDALGGDVKRIGSIRTLKPIRPWLFDAAAAFLYAWTFEADGDNDRSVKVICEIAQRLYQLGRGVDMAWAVGEIIEAHELEQRLAQFPGPIHHPCSIGGGLALGGVELGCGEHGGKVVVVGGHRGAVFPSEPALSTAEG